MSCSTSRILTGLVLLTLIAFSPQKCNAAFSCTQALEYLSPCEPFLLGFGDVTSGSPCCLGAQALSKAVASEEDRKSLCQCLKEVETIVMVNQDKAKQLPQLCQISSSSFNILPNSDCEANEKISEIQSPDAPGNSPGMRHG